MIFFIFTVHSLNVTEILKKKSYIFDRNIADKPWGNVNINVLHMIRYFKRVCDNKLNILKINWKLFMHKILLKIHHPMRFS